MKRKYDPARANAHPMLKAVDRLKDRCVEHRVPKPSIFSKGGLYEPMHARFWNAYGHRLLTIMPDGAIHQRADTDDNGMTDPHALACYERWFWQEIEGAARARRHGFIDLAFRRIATVRRIRRAHEGAIAMRNRMEAAA
jgi:hypothetical protein